MSNLSQIFVYGFPGKYGGAGTELHHQILLWKTMGIGVRIIPTNPHYKQEPLYGPMIEAGVTVHHWNEWDALTSEDAIIGFCNGEFLDQLPLVHQRTRKTIFVNCMTWLFEAEKRRMAEGKIAMFLYQNEDVMEKNMPILKAINSDPSIRFLTYRPYFHDAAFPFVENRPDDFFGCGRISRQDADKFAANTLHIYEYFVAPVMKRGLFMGFDARSEAKIGRPFPWITTVWDGAMITQQDFYKHCKIVLQPSDTTENWPRIGFEAMASGSVLIVDDRGGWQRMIDHGKTGWLCRNERDFIYYASKMAYEPELRLEIARAAQARGKELGGAEAAARSWQKVFDTIVHLG